MISIVTNESLLTYNFIINNKDKISMIGLSIDALDHDTNIKLGRSCNKDTLKYENLLETSKCIKENNIKLKINICVTKINIKQNYTSFFKTVKPNGIKIFQIKIVEGSNNQCKDIVPSIVEFKRFFSKYHKFNPVVETAEDMKSSYIMINSSRMLQYDMNKP